MNVVIVLMLNYYNVIEEITNKRHCLNQQLSISKLHLSRYIIYIVNHYKRRPQVCVHYRNRHHHQHAASNERSDMMNDYKSRLGSGAFKITCVIYRGWYRVHSRTLCPPLYLSRVYLSLSSISLSLYFTSISSSISSLSFFPHLLCLWSLLSRLEISDFYIYSFYVSPT